MRDTYRDFVRLPSAHAAYRSVLRGVAGGEGAVAFHCTAGKDRTGWGAAIMQLFAGVDPHTVMTDYLASSERTLAQYQPALEGFGARRWGCRCPQAPRRCLPGVSGDRDRSDDEHLR